MFIAWLAGALVVGIVNALLAAVIFMFTTIVGFILVGVFILMFIGYLVTPDEDNDDDSE